MTIDEYKALFVSYANRYPAQTNIRRPDLYYLKSFRKKPIASGDILFIESAPATFSKKLLSEFFGSLGVSITKDIDKATKILTVKDFTYKTFSPEFLENIDPFIARYEDHISFDSFRFDIIRFRNKDQTYHAFDEDRFTTIMSLVKSRNHSDKKLACVLIMYIDWKDNEIFLFYLLTVWGTWLRECRPSEIKGWSDFYNMQDVATIIRNPSIFQFYEYMKKYKITEQQQQILCKFY